MKKDNLYLIELVKLFADQKFINTADLREFYRNKYKQFEEKTFRRILYALERDNVIITIDRGIYCMNKEGDKYPHKKYVPTITPEIRSISDSIRKTFPYTKNLIWETRILYNFMLHQPGQNLTILETEKEAVESIFNFLENQFLGKVFLDPGQEIVEKYVFRNAESVIVSPMISRSPRQQINGIPCPKLEKILVDIFVDKDRFFIFQGQELVNIYNAVFHEYKVSESILFWYAARRLADQNLRTFISMKTDIRLIKQEDAIK